MTRRSQRLLLGALWATLIACSRSPQGDNGKPLESEAAASGSARPAGQRTLRVAKQLLAEGRIRVAPAALAAQNEELTVTGEITAAPDGAAEVGSPVAGIVREILVREGEVVAKGAPLATLDAAEAARTVAELGRAEARRERASRVLRQEQQLMQDQATSERNLAEAESELRAAEAEVRGARSLLTTFGATSGGRVTVRSPIAGTIVSRTVVLGRPVDAGVKLFRVVNAAKLIVRADVPEGDAADVADGVAATLAWPARKTACAAAVESRAPSVDALTRTIPFRLRPGARCPELVEGGFVSVTLPRRASSDDSLVALPRDAVVELDGVPLVFLAGASPAEFRPTTVRLARTSSSTAYIADGVKAGDQVVVSGAILLKGELMRAALE